MGSSFPIAVFDSGVGGLTVFKTLKTLLPFENFIYLADNKRVPYGGLSVETIVQYTSEAISFLEQQKVKLVVLGCHTASARYLGGDKVPVIGMIEGALQAIGEIPKLQKIAILGTLSTIESRVYEQLVLSQNPSLEVISIACPRLVPRIESGLFSDSEILAMVEEYVRPLKGKRVDAALLACTHYPLILNVFQKVLGSVLLIDPSHAVSLMVKDYLVRNDLLNNESCSSLRFCVTGNLEMFAKQAAHFLKEEIIPEKILLTQGINLSFDRSS